MHVQLTMHIVDLCPLTTNSMAVLQSLHKTGMAFVRYHCQPEISLDKK